jgi:dTDP-glucose pyrophosphorylase
MAGNGSRFTKAGYDCPKPLLPFEGRPLYSAVLDCFPLGSAETVVVLIRETSWGEVLADDLMHRYGHYLPQIVRLQEATRGQAETVLRAADLINPGIPLLIHNVDTLFETSWFSLKDDAPNWDGFLGVCDSVPGDQWSFAAASESGVVSSVEEKVRISSNACTGLYAFRNWCLFEESLAVNRGGSPQGEIYVAPIYNHVIARGGTVLTEPAAWMMPLGTPEEYENPQKYFSSTGGGRL